MRAVMAAGLYWEWIVGEGQAAGKKLGADYLEVHYQDLVLRPRDVLAQVEPFIEHQLDYDQITQVAIGSVAAPNTAFKGESRSPVARWKNDLPSHELEVLESFIGASLKRNGDALDSKASKQKETVRMKIAYRTYFKTKFWVKTRTPSLRSKKN